MDHVVTAALNGVAPAAAWPAGPPPEQAPQVVRPRTVFNLELDADRFGGLAIKARSRTFGEWTDEAQAVTWPGDDAGAQAINAYFRAVGRQFIEHVVSWNLTDEHGALEPVSLDALLGLDKQVVMDLFSAWAEAQAGKVEAPLDTPSPSGETSVEASIPMAPPSPNPPNWSTPS
ncbi:MAG TPA: hypothetical protein VHV49_02545 [Pseudonocardiaceae bacterium]|nr:hypothetical protein [Pseudonocardiaceae bacterium]